MNAADRRPQKNKYVLVSALLSEATTLLWWIVASPPEHVQSWLGRTR
jgi:hypothetical protein